MMTTRGALLSGPSRPRVASRRHPGRRAGMAMVAVLVATGLLFLVCGCGETNETTTTAGQTTGSTVTSNPTAPDTTSTAADAGTAADTTPEAAAAGTSGHISVKGLVDRPLVITAAELERMSVTEITVDHPKLGMTDYRGVRLSDLFKALGVQSAATSLTMAASDGYRVEVPLADLAASADALLAIGDGSALSVVIPGMESKSWVKDVVSFEFK